MKIFGFNVTTKKELKAAVIQRETEYIDCASRLNSLRDAFPFDLGQVVYDVALKNEKGRYTTTKPSFAHSTITEVTVDEKNYFSLVNRFRRNDVFFTYEAATDYLKFICQ